MSDRFQKSYFDVALELNFVFSPSLEFFMLPSWRVNLDNNESTTGGLAALLYRPHDGHEIFLGLDKASFGTSPLRGSAGYNFLTPWTPLEGVTEVGVTSEGWDFSLGAIITY